MGCCWLYSVLVLLLVIKLVSIKNEYRFNTTFWEVRVGVCRKPTDPSNPIRSNRLGQFLRLGGLGWIGLQQIFYSGSGWVWVIKLQTRQTWPDLLIFNIYLKYIIYLIIFFKSAAGHFYIYIYHIFNNLKKKTNCRVALSRFLLLILI